MCSTICFTICFTICLSPLDVFPHTHRYDSKSSKGGKPALQPAMALQPAFDAYHKVEGFLDWLFDMPLDIGEEALRAWRPDWTTERPTR
jgi:hypothetical protein